ncbi:RES family NAD+ phosphorylase [Aquirufa sp. ROCK-SH2]
MEVYRLAREKFATPLSGKGSAFYGARWNQKGTELIYTAQNRSLAMAEMAVHLTLATLPEDFVIITIEIPDDLVIQEFNESDLPKDWREFPFPPSTQKIGSNFVIENKNCVLKLPSVVVKGDFNLLINPNHSDFSKISIVNVEKFPFDKQIFE